MGDLTRDVYISPLRDLDNGGKFSPTTSTIAFGPTEAVLVDTQRNILGEMVLGLPKEPRPA